MGRYKIEFPCGLKIYEQGWRMENKKEFNYLLQDGCPLHGKNCQQNTRK